MALRKIVLEGDDILRKKSKAVTVFDERLHELLDDMWETMTDANGVGLAAPQVGIIRRAVVIDVTPRQAASDEVVETARENPPEQTAQMKYELINPVISYAEGETEESEGCLSIPGVSGMVKRPKIVRVKAQDRYGKEFEVTGAGLLAKALCHEIDHLEGILFTDIATSLEEPES
ncbi:MAG: peptide deformylase [Clostridiales Family XIII bacterium]|jgi:peptide deformylase|nr:peptide deformylase [Clostridiales Family XIII bacterium]